MRIWTLRIATFVLAGFVGCGNESTPANPGPSGPEGGSSVTPDGPGDTEGGAPTGEDPADPITVNTAGNAPDTTTGGDPPEEPAPAMAALAIELDQQFEFFFAGRFDRDWAHRGEVWFKGKDELWYFILPNGDLYRWDPDDGQDLDKSTFVASLEPVFNVDPSLLYLAHEQQMAFELDEQLGLFSSGNLFVNWAGHGEKWVAGEGDLWYFIMDDGKLYRWERAGDDPTRDISPNTFIGQLSSEFHADPSRLFLAANIANGSS